MFLVSWGSEFWHTRVEINHQGSKKIHVTITKTYLFIIAVAAVSPSSQYKKGSGLKVAPSADGVISFVA